MGTRDERVDAYISKSADFAQPILVKFRDLMHRASPDIEETIKWSSPCFQHKGLVSVMASFKKHVRISFWKGKLLSDDGILNASENADMAAFTVSDISEMPTNTKLLKLIKAAIKLNKDGVKLPSKSKPKRDKKDLKIPDDFLRALKANKKALETFSNFSYTNQKEYLDWVTSAKREATRESRLKTAIEWMSEGKPRNWKYM